MRAPSRPVFLCALAWLVALVVLAPGSLLAADDGVEAVTGVVEQGTTSAQGLSSGPPAAVPAVGGGEPASAGQAEAAPASAGGERQGGEQEGATDERPLARAAAGQTVIIRDFEFAPSSITVSVGDTVTWSNQGPSGHSATANDGSFDTGVLSDGQSGSHRFTRAGTFSYHCTPHPFMKGTVVVRAASAGGGGSGSGGGGGGGGSSPSDSGGQAGSSGAAGSSGEKLPATGGKTGLLAGFGVALVALGVLTRRRVDQGR